MLNVTLIVEFSSLWAIKLKKKIPFFSLACFLPEHLFSQNSERTHCSGKKKSSNRKKYLLEKKILYDICGISKVTKKATRKFFSHTKNRIDLDKALENKYLHYCLNLVMNLLIYVLNNQLVSRIMAKFSNQRRKLTCNKYISRKFHNQINISGVYKQKEATKWKGPSINYVVLIGRGSKISNFTNQKDDKV